MRAVDFSMFIPNEVRVRVRVRGNGRVRGRGRASSMCHQILRPLACCLDTCPYTWSTAHPNACGNPNMALALACPKPPPSYPPMPLLW